MVQPSRPNLSTDRWTPSAEALEQRLGFLNFSEEDRAHLRSLAELLEPEVEDLAEHFFAYLARFPEAVGLSQNPELRSAASAQKVAHLKAMFRGRYDASYMEERLELGSIYARAGLGTNLFLGAFNHLIGELGQRIMASFRDRPEEGLIRLVSLNKLAFVDVGLIVDAILFERERIIDTQAEEILELSTPVLQVRSGLLMLPLIGVIDTRRARRVTEAVLTAIQKSRARVVVVDITGVPAVDSGVAAHLIQTMTSARLMGATPLLTGISADVAQSLGTLGVAFDGVGLLGDLQQGLAEGERLLDELAHRAA